MLALTILRCLAGARAAMTLCPVCHRISRQVLLREYTPNSTALLFSSYTCPVCHTEFTQCQPVLNDNFTELYAKYLTDAEAYNREAMNNYRNQTEETKHTIENSKSAEVSNSLPHEENAKLENDNNQIQKVDDALTRKIEYWKRELLDTGKRNRMINYKESKRQTLRIIEPEATTLFNKLAFSEKPLSFQKPINKDSDFRTYSIISLMETLSYTLNVQIGDIKAGATIVEREKTLRNMRSKAKLAQEEQGTNILYLCFGFIYWKSSDRASAQWLKAPLLLMPVSLGIKSLNSPFTLSKTDDEIVVNPTLDYLFRTEYNICMPAFEQKNRHSFDEFILQIENIVDRRGWRVTREVSLGLLSFLKISMYHDIVNHQDKIFHHPVLRAMAGDHEAIKDLPEKADDFDFDSVKPGEWHEVVDSDSSQEEAILLSKLGVSFVMQGPPGTGKSQTITNIIAEALGDGKKVLFVSEKAAALQVVLKRLTEVGLSDFCLSLHNYKANKKEIIDNIGANLHLEAETVSRSATNELMELFRDRSFLNKYAQELHQVLKPLNISLYAAFGRFSSLSDATSIDFELENIKEISDEQYSTIMYCLDAFEKALHQLNGKLTDNPWYKTVIFSAGQAFQKQFFHDTEGLSIKLRRIADISSLLSKEIGIGFDGSYSSAELILNVSRLLQSRPQYMNQNWFTPNTIENGRRTLYEAQQYSRLFAQSKSNILAEWDESILAFSLDKLKEYISKYSWLYSETYSDCPEKGITREQNAAEKSKELIKQLIESAQDAFDLLKISHTLSIDSIRQLSEMLILIRETQSFETKWFDYRNHQYLLETVQQAEQKEIQIAKGIECIESDWESQILEIDCQEFLVRFKTQYTASFLQTKDDYEKDLSLLMIHKKTASNYCDDSNIIELLQAILKYRKNTVWLENQNDNLHNGLGLLYRGKETDWKKVENSYLFAQKIIRYKTILLDAVTHGRALQRFEEELFKDWEPSIIEIDAEAILSRFKTDYLGMFYKMKASYKADINTLRTHAKTIGARIEKDTAINALQIIRNAQTEKEWLDNHEKQLSEILGDIYRGVETDWQRVLDEIELSEKLLQNSTLIEDSFAHHRNITEAISLIQRDWELSSIDIDAENMLKRFKSYYTEAFHNVNNQYEEDINVFRMYSKYGLDTIDTSQIIKLLQDILVIRKAKQWLQSNRSVLSSIIGRENIDHVDWHSVCTGISSAARIMELAPYHTLSQNSISVIVSISNDGELSKQISKYSKSLTLSTINNVEQKIEEARYLENGIALPIALSKTELFIEECKSQTDLLSELINKKINHELKYRNISLLIEQQEIYNNAQKWFANHHDVNAILFSDAYQGVNTNWQAIENGFDTAESVNGLFDGITPNQIIQFACQAPLENLAFDTAVSELNEELQLSKPQLQSFVSMFENDRFLSKSVTEIAHSYDLCENGFQALTHWIDYIETRAECDRFGLSDFTAKIVQRDNTISDVKSAFEKGFYSKWIKENLKDYASVGLFRRRIHDQYSERFSKLDKKQYDIAKKKIRSSIIKTFPDLDRVSKAGSEIGILQHEMNKKRMIMPIRKLFKSIPNLLLQLKPCLMMSPLSVAYFLEADSYKFDMVIFDEASQVFPQDAIGAILRANQVIIAGDTKQLPPTNFFSSSTSNSSDSYDNDEEDEEVYDSILEETASILPNRTLRWHYRSRHEHLIAFSNQEIYKNELVTFPSSNEGGTDTGVEFVFVEDGYYEPRPKNYNIAEAKKCVELVKAHIDHHPERSLGIIAFNEKQQQAILLELARFREKNPSYEAFFTEDKEDEFFVKNLENVQGDERDTIIFSIAFAKTKVQKSENRPMSMNFGPLNRQGGERRLNVAITRAKINIKLVSSILPSDIDLSRTEAEGVKMLRSYIEFAMNGDASLASAHRNAQTDEFVNTITRFIREHGFIVQQYVGCSGYKIDIAIRHPSEIVSQFVAGIECDGLSYVSARTARDRDRLRSSVLKNMGWNLYRIWSAEWYKNPMVEGQNLISFINNAIHSYDKQIKELEEQKHREEEQKRKAAEKAKAEREAEERRKKQEDERKAEIAKREAEERRKRQEAERKRKSEQEQARKRAEEEKLARLRQSKSTPITDSDNSSLSWVKYGAVVRHKNFGKGMVLSVSSNQVVIRFGYNNIRTFTYPESFYKGIIVRFESESTKKVSTEAQSKIGAKVYSKYFGYGTIKSIHKDQVVVVFNDGEKTFVYPSAFRTGYLKMAEENK